MSPDFPFGKLLDALNDAGFCVDARQRLDFYALASRYDGCSRAEFSQATASLFAANADEYKKILAIFDRIYPGEGGILEAEPKKAAKTALKKSWGKRLLLALGYFGATIVLLVLGLALARQVKIRSAPPETINTSGGRVNAPPEEAAAPPPPAPPPKSFIEKPAICVAREAMHSYWLFPLLASGGCFFIALALAGFTSGRKKAKKHREKALARALLSLGGPRNYRIDFSLTPMSVEQLDAMISLLEEALASVGHTRELDIDRSVEHTVQSGLVPSLHYRARHGALRALLLVDMGDLCRPYRAKINQFINRLRQRGLELEILYFDRDPSRVSKKPGSRLFALDSMITKLGGIPMIILSTGEALAQAPPSANAQLLQAWPHRLLLHPMGNPKSWPSGLESESAGIQAFPLSREGLLAARQALREQRSRVRAPKMKYASKTAQQRHEATHAHLLKGMLAMAPKPSFELAWALRERFFPGTPEEIVLGARHFIEQGYESIEPESFEIAKQEALNEFRALDASGELQRQSNKFLIELLARSEPITKNSAAHLRWQRDLAFVQLQSGQAEQIPKALQTLSQLAQGPLRAELSKQVELRQVEGDRGDRLSKTLQSVKGARLKLPLGSLFSWSWPSLKSTVILIFSFGLGAGILYSYGFYSVKPLPWGGILLGKSELEKALCLSVSGVHDVLVFEGNNLILGSEQENPRRFRALYIQPFAPFYRLRKTDFQFDTTELGAEFIAQWGTPEASGTGPGANTIAYVVADLLQYSELSQSYSFAGFNSFPMFGNPPAPERVLPLKPTVIPRDELEGIRWQYSQNILPGTGEEVWCRLIDPLCPRAKEPPPKPETPMPQSPKCENGRVDCGGQCVDLQNDQNHCGNCDIQCGKDLCVAGKCQSDAKSQPLECPVGETACGTECKNLSTDILNCGACSKACGPDKVCANGLCQPCPAGLTKCGSGCVNTSTHSLHCSGCFQSCGKGELCAKGICSPSTAPAPANPAKPGDRPPNTGKPGSRSPNTGNPSRQGAPDKSPGGPVEINLDEPEPEPAPIPVPLLLGPPGK